MRCPVAGCAHPFEVDSRRLGRRVECPACGAAMTARPLGVNAKLAAQQQRLRGSSGIPAARLPIALLVDNVRSLWNVGSIFRTADACGVREIVLAGISGCPPRPQISKTALGAEEAVPWRYRAEAMEGLTELARAGYTTVAIETSPRAVAFDRFEWPAAVCLVIGNEVAGVGEELLDACERHVSIPMRGVKDSLNVAVAFGIVAHHVGGELQARAKSRAGRQA